MENPTFRLRHIPDTVCPHCGDSARAWSQGDQHSNGDFNERIEFQCGEVLTYSPNLQRVSSNETCFTERQKQDSDNFWRNVDFLSQIQWDQENYHFVAEMYKIYQTKKAQEPK